MHSASPDDELSPRESVLLERQSIAINRFDDETPDLYRRPIDLPQDVTDWIAGWGGRSLFLTGAIGVGKALLNSTELATPNGPRAIGSMQVGDIVFGGDGATCRVVGVYPQGTRQLWRLHLRDGRSVVCDAEHLWLVTTASDRHRGIPAKVMTLAEMMEIGMTFANGAARWHLPMPGPVEYAGAELPLDPYTLGVLIGDGALTSGSPRVTTPDPEILDLIKLPAGVTSRALPNYRPSKAITYLFKGSGAGRPNPLTVALRELGLMELRSSERFIPKSYLAASIEDRFALLSGLVDTDGYIKGTRISVSTSSERLASDIRSLVWSLGGTATARRKETTHLPSWTVQFSLPASMPCPAKLARRRNIWTVRRDGRGATIAVTGVERVLDGDATCIAVDSPDHTYLTADYVRTHNTHTAWKTCRRWLEAQYAPGQPWQGTPIISAWRSTALFDALRPDAPDGEGRVLSKKLQKVDLLFIDDLAAARATSWTQERLFEIFDERYIRRRPVIITCDVLPGQLSEVTGPRVASRLAEMCGDSIVLLEGPDRRQGRAA
ncbi:LAGLIDADG family homing endonuclease [Streptomyces sp. NPDC004227]